ncbi:MULTISPECIES: tellurite resistance TerB family protein [unclassified Xanthobacter]|uniref:tellurite resistance TerB family protein n=1 Tax=unclassified Xanthobacter TaxID=2623496 RepID=UPI001EDE5568|nr:MULTISPECIES: DUF533 domain-containing protein [unclassified Xanthobacter]
MADAGSLLGELLGAALRNGSVRGGSASGGADGLGDILQDVLGGAGRGGSAPAPSGGLDSILGEVLGQVLGGTSPSRGGNTGGAASGGTPAGLPGGLGDLLGGILGGGRGSSAPSGGSAGGLPGGLNDVLGQILGGGAASGGSRSGGGGLGDFAQDALGGAGSVPASVPSSQPSSPSIPQPAPTPTPDGRAPSGGSDLLKYGGLAVIGMLAFNAFRKWQAGQGGRANFVDESSSAFSPVAAPGGPEAFSQALLLAMAAAAQADGQLDQDELNRITGGIARMGAGSPDQQALIHYLTTPVDPQRVVDAAITPEAALQLYAASAMAIRPDSAVERAYLTQLAGALGIDPSLKAQVDADLNA